MGKNDLKRAAKHSQNVGEIFKRKTVVNNNINNLRCFTVVSNNINDLCCFTLVSNNFCSLKETTIRQRSGARWRASSTEEKISTSWIRKEENNEVFFPERLVCCTSVDSRRRVIAHFAMYAYGHTTEVASLTTILSHNAFLKDTPTGKMQVVMEDVSRVTNCWRSQRSHWVHSRSPNIVKQTFDRKIC